MIEPQYLSTPRANGVTYGRVEFHDGYYRIVDAGPAVREAAKRMFPGCGRGDQLWFRATRRAVGDLNWLLLRYPMSIENKCQYERDRCRAIAHAVRRDRNQHLEPVAAPANFAGTLMDFQAVGVTYLIANERCLLADDMGLGKTVTTLAAMAQSNAWPVLVVVPTNVQRQWQRQIGAFLRMTPAGELLADPTGEKLSTIVRGLKPYELPDVPIVIIHYGLLRGWLEPLEERRFATVVFDEIQELRHTGTYKYSVASKLAGDADRVWGLSGTPIYNYGEEIWSVLNILDYHCLGDFDSFTREWGAGYGSRIVAKPEVLSDHLKREGLMLRRRKADVQNELPPKRRVVVTIDHDEDVYARLIRDVQRLARGYDQIAGFHERGQASLRIEGESRRATGVSKAGHVAAFVRSLLEAGERPLVYAWHHDVHDAIAAGLGGDWAWQRITGQETQKEKERAIERFAADQASVVLMSLRATAGLDGLQGKGTCVVFAELDWSPAIHAQCEDRLHRIGIGEMESLLCYYLVSATGYDGVVMDALGLKIGQFTGIMGDATETPEERDAALAAGRKHLERIIDALRGRKASSEECETALSDS